MVQNLSIFWYKISKFKHIQNIVTSVILIFFKQCMNNLYGGLCWEQKSTFMEKTYEKSKMCIILYKFKTLLNGFGIKTIFLMNTKLRKKYLK